MQANNTKAMSARAEAIKALVKPKEVKPKVPEGASHKFDRLALLAHSKHGKQAHAHMARECRLCGPKVKAQSPSQDPGCNSSSSIIISSNSGSGSCSHSHSQGCQAPKGAQVPAKAP
ncbi:60S ribosomal protein L29 [Sciurus carolinensis]|uniref:60S ribosomal protein L29 n=1 Tax=Sciurus carolinensis TaxID=30640 RepID=A0AA41T1F1_SCICA|nr:60S ribosomal protein L29 [Sciurus carolinensis]